MSKSNNLTCKYLEKKHFLKNLGLKLELINKFLENEITKDEIQNLDFIQLFKKYLNNFQYMELKESMSVKEEIINYRQLGFTLKYATKYVNQLKNVYMNDLTINWIFRIVENKFILNGEKKFETYLKKFDKNSKKLVIVDISTITNCEQCLEPFNAQKDRCILCKLVCCEICKSSINDTCYICDKMLDFID